ncbi:hypothetical protein AB1283_11520 [Bacillus sp. S13(2024)]|uniref:hypothetical protein n=1 Tax=unclassified Bacillus (in: firmicutes) TaxID=185979 RepID=UPI003D210443
MILKAQSTSMMFFGYLCKSFLVNITGRQGVVSFLLVICVQAVRQPNDIVYFNGLSHMILKAQSKGKMF